MTDIKTGRCHCGAVQFELSLVKGMGSLLRCNCSLCRRRGVVVVSVHHEQLRITQGQDKLALYQWNTRVAKHYFCKTCGIYTHHQRRSVPTETSINVACVDGLDLEAAGLNITLVDGASNSLVTDSRA